ncbi:hypothetical protein [Anaerovibrio sp.]|uniref:hypothetical protein n=1 Tax=Anaerovibrio sp. TaxID=1872532 RepID=UPI0025C68BFF|nr:hypothetical protein [Anaerovibrio sp.]MBR2143138.1 hypothetical protein [Anaerovibrio sp.]
MAPNAVISELKLSFCVWQIATALGLAVNMVNDAFIHYHNFKNAGMTYHDFGEGLWDCVVGQVTMHRSREMMVTFSDGSKYRLIGAIIQGFSFATILFCLEGVGDTGGEYREANQTSGESYLRWGM